MPNGIAHLGESPSADQGMADKGVPAVMNG
jgi:hypothetical protein